MSRRPYRIQLYWQGRSTPRPRLAEELWQCVGSLPWASPRLARLQPYSQEGELLPPITSAAHAESLLAHWTVRWRTGAVERTAYKAPFVLDSLDDSKFRFELTTGIEPLGFDGVWVPNRLEVLVDPEAPDGLASRDVLLAILHVGARVFDPDWGFAALDGEPVPPTPLFSSGDPMAAWMTYLSKRFPLADLAVAEPSAVYSVGELGYLVIAYPEPPRPGSARQGAALEAVTAAFRAAQIVR